VNGIMSVAVKRRQAPAAPAGAGKPESAERTAALQKNNGFGAMQRIGRWRVGDEHKLKADQ